MHAMSGCPSGKSVILDTSIKVKYVYQKSYRQIFNRKGGHISKNAIVQHKHFGLNNSSRFPSIESLSL
ncbi:hypothetical protein RhiirA1_429121 [Rhizophagus irregularis]|uniref:Uncharacterized protein n=1 Tax=Rhizophagus irregularis TaxID=588596 RepID=A0A2N0QZC6_9GLOM|nr:hypothetical protein RhiirA1_429121 [Rhizophagus irregularis]